MFWNEVAGHSIAELGGSGPPLGSAEAAIVHTAVYDAVNAICGYQFTPYAVTPEVRRPALPDAAVAAAARDVLVALYPDQQEELDQKYAELLEAIPGHHRAKLNGIAAGQQAAAGNLQFRADDGRYAGTPWQPPAPSGTLYVATVGGGVRKPTDNGNTWTSVDPDRMSSRSFRLPWTLRDLTRSTLACFRHSQVRRAVCTRVPTAERAGSPTPLPSSRGGSSAKPLSTVVKQSV